MQLQGQVKRKTKESDLANCKQTYGTDETTHKKSMHETYVYISSTEE